MSESHDKQHRASASQFFVAAELCRRGWVAVVTTGNCPNTDILCSNKEGTRFVHIQVKTFRPGDTTCSVGRRAEKDYGKNFFWVLGGIPRPESNEPPTYYIIPARTMATRVKRAHEKWLATPGKRGQEHQHTDFRTVYLPPGKDEAGWSIETYMKRWDLIEARLR